MNYENSMNNCPDLNWSRYKDFTWASHMEEQRLLSEWLMDTDICGRKLMEAKAKAGWSTIGGGGRGRGR